MPDQEIHQSRKNGLLVVLFRPQNFGRDFHERQPLILLGWPTTQLAHQKYLFFLALDPCIGSTQCSNSD